MSRRRHRPPAARAVRNLEAQPRGKSRELLVLSPRRANRFSQLGQAKLQSRGLEAKRLRGHTEQVLLLDSRNGKSAARACVAEYGCRDGELWVTFLWLNFEYDPGILFCATARGGAIQPAISGD